MGSSFCTLGGCLCWEPVYSQENGVRGSTSFIWGGIPEELLERFDVEVGHRLSKKKGRGGRKKGGFSPKKRKKGEKKPIEM